MNWVLLVVVLLILMPFFTYMLSKIQMIGWLNAIKSNLEYQEKIKEEKADGEEKKTLHK